MQNELIFNVQVQLKYFIRDTFEDLNNIKYIMKDTFQFKIYNPMESIQRTYPSFYIISNNHNFIALQSS